jgi:hypothetical protein
MQYWNHKGKYSEVLDKAWDELVPDSGEAETEIGKLVRAFGRINYELFNNGCCNMFEELLNEDYEGSLDIEVDSMFQDFLNTILEATNNPDLVAALERECRIVYETGNFEKEKWMIDLVGDAVGEIVENYYLNNEN